MSPPSVSIVTPSLNQARFLAAAIESVSAQGYPDIEHRIYDGGSTDETPALLERYSDRIVATVEADGGQACAVNRGLREARGEIIGWLNSDDFYYPNAISTVVDYMTAYPECSVVYGAAHYVDERGARLEPYPTGTPDDLRFGCFLCQPAVFLRRRALEPAGLLDETLRYCMDYDWWLRLRQHFDFHQIPEELAAYRLHDESKSVAEQRRARQEVVRVAHRHFGAAPLTLLYGYANFLARDWVGKPLDDRVEIGFPGKVLSIALTAALALRYHPVPTREDFRLFARRVGGARTLAPGDFPSPGRKRS